MIVLGIETSCDETGVALYNTTPWEEGKPAFQGILGQGLHSQIAMHRDYGGVVPELASRDHIRRVLPLLDQSLAQSGLKLADIDAVAFTQGPGLAGALLVGSAFAKSLAQGLNLPSIGVHHLEGHLLSPLLGQTAPQFPFIALLVSGGHTQLMKVSGIGQYELLGETLDDAAGEAFDKTAKLLGLDYPGGAAISKLAEQGRPGIFDLPKPMLHSGDLDFSFSGLKTAVLNQAKKFAEKNIVNPSEVAQFHADLARSFVDSIVAVLVSKSEKALKQTACKHLVLAGGVGANLQLRAALNDKAKHNGFEVHYPPLELCTDNGVMIAFAGALRMIEKNNGSTTSGAFDIKPRWDLQSNNLK
ncbi:MULTISPECIES: tRNA (adenosine(37)-N6)-threonylcarbamoyltransferase complex transferase subunit TsaD [unclassified Polynucleobacter]|jgi:N6-L-threonylcarbamoyladenine synthase|uniref:tRNA (adenosine(37)-N6)-threonylcarbamoyltransferase complex transferase subunit TsaD n=1 Tax=unclassified Polynucleobacter TaxID=2640945 RepID=UPI000925DA03|nr:MULTISPECIES: tRNA (adenosine(37)-N6)-threonylcarbamoyltransferase complex transferase subunit TsaD [unclassified Polynucleobacter]MBU3562488.1 tRNA (adenosine(37)-N6)-threonylcarbamoyltransferase complex transferase subunit TsaD [Polynucleobacter sp. Tro8-14-1]MEA9568522.1 tRNA (adenosine(37)-N6)-threonylcarbamoyltransferase complex transferase subunit TsaD [Polynucleobacter sp. AP-Nickl1-40-C4]OJI05455.1 tRNA N6-adenosine(37)-threonylcarbamoyltransferase complex transferase subunit TsaD [Po